MNRGKSYLSLFFFFLFLFPQVEKGIHDFRHGGDFYCQVKDTKHLHSQQHSCAFCDYNLPALQEATSVSVHAVIPVILFSYSVYREPAYSSCSEYGASPRAPPLV